MSSFTAKIINESWCSLFFFHNSTIVTSNYFTPWSGVFSCFRNLFKANLAIKSRPIKLYVPQSIDWFLDDKWVKWVKFLAIRKTCQKKDLLLCAFPLRNVFTTCEISKIFFAKIINEWKLLSVFSKKVILDVSQDSEYVSIQCS